MSPANKTDNDLPQPPKENNDEKNEQQPKPNPSDKDENEEDTGDDFVLSDDIISKIIKQQSAHQATMFE